MDNHKTLYLGLEIPKHLSGKDVIHYPIIQIVPRPIKTKDIEEALKSIFTYTHIIFTSKTGVRILFEYLPYFGCSFIDLKSKTILAVGHSTAQTLIQQGIEVDYIAKEETSEGMVQLLSELDLAKANILWPHSGLSRKIIPNFLEENNVHYRDCILYDTIPSNQSPLPDLTQIQEIIFTSPSTIDAFLLAYSKLPSHAKLSTIGPVTKAHLLSKMAKKL